MRRQPIRGEYDWLLCQVPRHMIQFLQGRTSDRKLRLWACAFERNWYPADEDRQGAVALAEAWADGGRPTHLSASHAFSVCGDSAWTAAYYGAVRALEKHKESDRKREAMRFQLVTVRDVFGNPFRPVTLDPAWLTSDVLALAQGIYDERAFDRMPILADALQDAGCADWHVLTHCRDAGQVHVRGCWVVDLLLGKS